MNQWYDLSVVTHSEWDTLFRERKKFRLQPFSEKPRTVRGFWGIGCMWKTGRKASTH